jgi:2-desacetyl-2-hydroxyethyl bacteriochlorophyllide A dehydrogenase
MKAVVIRAPHDVSFAEESAPRPREGQVLVRVAAAGICMSDVETWKGTRPEPYVRYPVIPGHEWCGTIAELGPGVTGLRAGQRVAVEGHNFCRTCAWCQRGETNLCATYNEHGFTLPGGFADYVVTRADLAHPFSDALPFEAAALTEPFACVVHGMRRTRLDGAETVAVLGSGTLSLLAVAAASKLWTPARTVVVTRSRTNEAIARQVGATAYLTVDADPVARLHDLTGGRGADVVLEAVGHESAVPLAFALARRGGAVALMGIAGGGKRPLLDPDVFALKDLRVHGVFAYASRDYEEALRLIESGRVDVRPLITHRFALAEFQRALDLLSSRTEPVVKVILQP